MRLKEIKPGMVIHCKNDEEKKALDQAVAGRMGDVDLGEKINKMIQEDKNPEK